MDLCSLQINYCLPILYFLSQRYYGKSLPFGEKSFDGKNIGLLSIEQALADYAFFLKYFKRTFKAEKCPIVAFGGRQVYLLMIQTKLLLLFNNAKQNFKYEKNIFKLFRIP